MNRKLVVAAFSILLLSLVANFTSAFQDSPLDKVASETWEQYLFRLIDVGEITQEQFDRWNHNGELIVSSINAIQKSRTETRTQSVIVQRTRTVTNDAGEEITEVYPETVTQNYTVNVPYTENVVRRITIPAKGSRPDSEAFNEFGKAELVNQPLGNTPPVSSPARPTKEDLQAESRKLATENWDAYVERLVGQGLLKTEHLTAWKKGEDVDVEAVTHLIEFRTETRSRSVPVTRVKSEKRDGKLVNVPYTETVTQTYQVAVPVSQQLPVSFKLPGRGTKRTNAITKGFKFVDQEGTQTSAKASRFSSKRLKNRDKLAKLMKHKPRQADAKYTRRGKLKDLTISEFKKDDVVGWEVKNLRGEALRLFFDIDGDDKLDNWVYFEDGKETYREIDLDGDGKVDQYQYTDGSKVKYGIDKDQDGEIDSWKK